MRHIIMLLCSLLLSTGTLSADEFAGYVAEQWGVELSNNIEEVTSSHITTDDVRTTEGSAWPESLRVYVCVTDEEKQAFRSYGLNALIEAQSWKTPRVRNAIPENLFVSIIVGAQAPCIAAEPREGAHAADVASCTLQRGSDCRLNGSTTFAVCGCMNAGAGIDVAANGDAVANATGVANGNAAAGRMTAAAGGDAGDRAAGANSDGADDNDNSSAAADNNGGCPNGTADGDAGNTADNDADSTADDANGTAGDDADNAGRGSGMSNGMTAGRGAEFAAATLQTADGKLVKFGDTNFDRRTGLRPDRPTDIAPQKLRTRCSDSPGVA